MLKKKLVGTGQKIQRMERARETKTGTGRARKIIERIRNEGKRSYGERNDARRR